MDTVFLELQSVRRRGRGNPRNQFFKYTLSRAVYPLMLQGPLLDFASQSRTVRRGSTESLGVYDSVTLAGYPDLPSTRVPWS
jgi:hypothetical protein